MEADGSLTVLLPTSSACMAATPTNTPTATVYLFALQMHRGGHYLMLLRYAPKGKRSIAISLHHDGARPDILLCLDIVHARHHAYTGAYETRNYWGG